MTYIFKNIQNITTHDIFNIPPNTHDIESQGISITTIIIYTIITPHKHPSQSYLFSLLLMLREWYNFWTQIPRNLNF